MAKIETQEQLQAFAKLHGLRVDWHEPDEQGVSASVRGEKLDNAMGTGYHDELNVTLYIGGGGYYDVNLANLFAWASEAS